MKISKTQVQISLVKNENLINYLISYSTLIYWYLIPQILLFTLFFCNSNVTILCKTSN